MGPVCARLLVHGVHGRRGHRPLPGLDLPDRSVHAPDLRAGVADAQRRLCDPRQHLGAPRRHLL